MAEFDESKKYQEQEEIFVLLTAVRQEKIG
jgi:hypothetical protein